MDCKLDEEGKLMLQGLTEAQKTQALTLYASREKKKWLAYVLWIVFAAYYIYLGRIVRNIILWVLMCCFIGVIWWVVDLFRISGMVDKKNKEILIQCINEAKSISNQVDTLV